MGDTTTIPADFEDLLQSGTAILATLNADGQPQLTAIWFLYEDGKVCISLNTGRHKYKNLLRDPRATFFILDPENPLRSLEIRGTVSVEDDPGYVAADRVGAKYGGADLRTFDEPGATRAFLTLNPTKVLGNKIG
ncbi:MAG TPA: PPOX class F420-dependent oxidoreductase [Jatrophihabitans sp.]|jgi:PPOX class probable F420-dependent enzyme